ncbi:venom serine protease inhibitor-like [Ischnura elegans]|uniref:venom serine protease inhibitor-like n=1 Tax=Ischnura elegans TaxID=197161 RepID=UPI001ED881A2|nr:venom serine protease inhibitor-like [Ischnura elegans]
MRIALFVASALAFAAVNAEPQMNTFQAVAGPNLAAANTANFDLASLFSGPVSGNPRCRRNEIFLTCGSRCTITCGNFLQTTTTCPTGCRPGCFCVGGTVRDELNGGLCVNPLRCRRWRIRPIRDRSSSEEDSRSSNERRKHRSNN